MLIRARREPDVPRCVTLLRAVHEHDGYPAVWPSDPGRWLTSAGTDLAAWVAVDDDGTIRGHAAVQAGHDDPQLAALAGCPAGLLMLVVRLLWTGPAGSAAPERRCWPRRPITPAGPAGSSRWR